ncbi:hypothetical protein ACROYT_G028490 [Oculina patagonica]
MAACMGSGMVFPSATPVQCMEKFTNVPGKTKVSVGQGLQCGGRMVITTTVQLYHLADGSQAKTYYRFDFPFNKNVKYPVGHPENISQPGHTDIPRYFGIANALCAHPCNYFPCDAHLTASKLTFSLFIACVQGEMTKSILERSTICTHTDRLPDYWHMVHLRMPDSSYSQGVALPQETRGLLLQLREFVVKSQRSQQLAIPHWQPY